MRTRLRGAGAAVSSSNWLAGRGRGPCPGRPSSARPHAPPRAAAEPFPAPPRGLSACWEAAPAPAEIPPDLVPGRVACPAARIELLPRHWELRVVHRLLANIGSRRGLAVPLTRGRRRLAGCGLASDWAVGGRMGSRLVYRLMCSLGGAAKTRPWRGLPLMPLRFGPCRLRLVGGGIRELGLRSGSRRGLRRKLRLIGCGCGNTASLDAIPESPDDTQIAWFQMPQLGELLHLRIGDGAVLLPLSFSDEPLGSRRSVAVIAVLTRRRSNAVAKCAGAPAARYTLHFIHAVCQHTLLCGELHG